jgi:hypothetical protein
MQVVNDLRDVVPHQWLTPGQQKFVHPHLGSLGDKRLGLPQRHVREAAGI